MDSEETQQPPIEVAINAEIAAENSVENSLSKNVDAPVVRRRRRIVRHHVREKTPEPTAKNGVLGTKPKYSDDDEGGGGDGSNISEGGSDKKKKSHRITTIATNASTNTETVRPPSVAGEEIAVVLSANPETTPPPKSAVISAHHSKILSRRDRCAGGSAAVRSQSTPRPVDETKVATESAITTLIRHAKRSLSSPRHKEESPPRSRHERDQAAPVREIAPPEPPKRVHDTEDTKRELSKLERNLRRFEEERRRFEVEKLRFDEEKRELDRLRNRRLEEFERRRAEKREAEQRQADDVHQKLYTILRVIEDSKHQLPSILKSDSFTKSETTTTSTEDETMLLSSLRHPKVPPRYGRRADDVLEFPESVTGGESVGEDYESSTAMSSSSRDGDFDDEDEIVASTEATVVPSKDINGGPATHVVTQSSNGAAVKDPVSNVVAAVPVVAVKQSWLGRLFRRGGTQTPLVLVKNPVPACQPSIGPVSMKRFIFVESRLIWNRLVADHPDEWAATMRQRNRCIADLVILSIFCGLGGMVFRFVEGSFENFYKCGVRRVKRDFVDNLWHTSHNLREDDWKTMARSKLRKFEEELHAAHEAGMTSYSGMKAWTFINGMIYCMTVITTIGYGHIYPSTNTGRAITIVYAIIGIPMFLILLADFGKLFTRGIKFLWAYVRRLYYTGSIRKVRKQAQVQEIMRGMNIAYDFATFRRPSMMMKEAQPSDVTVEDSTAGGTETLTNKTDNHLSPPASTIVGTPTTPVPTEIDIDDEFNLPISLAFIILLAYIFCGASVYSIWEEWSFFESCYFVFISMSTIGFGDYVPKHPIYMMASIIYLVFGLALTSMCINVVQVKLSDSFRQASAKIGATIGLAMAEEESAALASQTATPSVGAGSDAAVPAVHGGAAADYSVMKLNGGDTEAASPPPLLPKKRDSLTVSENSGGGKEKKSKKKGAKK